MPKQADPLACAGGGFLLIEKPCQALISWQKLAIGDEGSGAACPDFQSLIIQFHLILLGKI